MGGVYFSLASVDELLERDARRQQDGFPRKISLGRLVRPGQGGKDRVVVIPTVKEEKFLHDTRPQEPSEEIATGGAGDGQVGDVIGEEPIHGSGSGSGGAGQGDSGEHEIEASAYDLGRILSEKFELPHLTDKKRRRVFQQYKFDLTDRHIGSGQLLDIKATLRRVVETNIILGRVPGGDLSQTDSTDLLVSPKDRVYRILSREKTYESQALVFFIRDYSGSMAGPPTELVINQHVLIYSWLLYQYDRRVVSRFILHDAEAKEVPDFNVYYNSSTAGGTQIVSAYVLVNRLIEEENLAADYNLYVFHGTDGDDWDNDGSQAVPEIKKTLGSVNRLGITVINQSAGDTTLQKYLNKSSLLERQTQKIRLDSMTESADETRLIDGIKFLISP